MLPLLLLLVAVEWHCRTHTLVVAKKRYVEKKKDYITTLILGDSHAHNGIVPGLISDSAASLALGGQPLAIDYYLLRQYQPKMPRLHTVLLEVSPHRLWHDLDSQHWNAYLYHIVYGIPYHTETFSLSNYSFVLAAPHHGTAHFLDYYTPGHNHPVRDSTGFPLSDSAGRFASVGYDGIRIEAGFHMPHSWAGTTDSNAAYLQQIAAFCTGHGIRLVLFTTPVSRSYAAHIPPAARTEAQRIIDRISRQYHLVLLNHTTDSCYHLHHFRDEDHLSPFAARMFSTMLKKEMVTHAPCYRISNDPKQKRPHQEALSYVLFVVSDKPTIYHLLITIY